MPKKKKVVSKSERRNKSQASAAYLKKMAGSNAVTISVQGKNIPIPLPQADELKKIAKHIHFLELCVTGLSYADRRTIAKLTRRIGTLERMVANRDAKIGEHKDQVSALQTEHKAYIEHITEKFERELAHAKKITPKQAHEIEKKFIENLQTNYEIRQALSKAHEKGVARGLNESAYVYGSATTDNRHYRIKY